jgi:hypothetical protein
MARSIYISGDESKQLTVKVDDVDKQFSLDQDISAKELFDILQFKMGDIYDVVRGDPGAIPQAAFDALCKLMDDIAEQISAIADPVTTLEEDDDDYDFD